MKKFLAAVVLALVAATAYAQDPAQGASSTKTIKDPTEYNAYISATGLTDPAQKAAALEQFAQQYPNSIVKEDALTAAMAAYQQANNSAKASAVANSLLQTNPNNVEALAVLVYSKRNLANAGQNTQQNLTEAGQMAVRGLQAMQGRAKPEGVSDEDFKKRNQVFTVVFNGAAGQAALANKDYANAQKYLRAAVEGNPNDPGDVYPLALAYLSPKPLTPEAAVNGLWFIARAANLVSGNTAAFNQIATFGKKSYSNFHGSPDGWDQLLAQTKTAPLPPPGFTITQYVPPTPADQAAEMMTKEDPAKMDFAKWIFILTSGNKDAATKVWTALEGKTLPPFLGKVIAATPEKLTLAVTANGFDSNTPEVEVTMAKPYKTPPAVGSQVQMQGNAVSYTENPFLMKLNQGVQLDAPKAPAKKPAAKRPGSTTKKQ